ncbi:hypothetical protein [Sulfurirhabdus autotrophica]|uniref:Uncharacterized protein n=1 Tax=Sulfurirhabdus autotrophica TaxID=1706046 RepID=A0A4R3Y2B2_9PROT|nr:hypothetical protein [Sulfurirhabdus autotrophica]TCV85830.1 hypothetical protein EDC63_10838 [Sulfurirhabdus autotrophica]
MKNSRLSASLLKVADYPLVAALINRRSRRFAVGMDITRGPLQFSSQLPPMPLAKEEEELLLFAGIGDTGNNIGDMAFDEHTDTAQGTGNSEGRTLMNFRGRTIPSACGAHTSQIFLTNDDGVFFNPCHHELPQHDVPSSIVKVSNQRLEIPRRLPYMHAFNQPYSNVAGSTYFIPVTSVVPIYLNLLLLLLSEEYGFFIIDTENADAPCGLADFRQSQGGHLYEQPKDGRIMRLRDLDSMVAETAAIEQGIICQNMMLMTQAMGLGGSIQTLGSGRHMLGCNPEVFEGLGFQFEAATRSGVPSNPIGRLPVWNSLLPPFVKSMSEAVQTVVKSKFGPEGFYRQKGYTPWKPETFDVPVLAHSERTIDAAIAFCEYVQKIYGRFPAHVDAFRCAYTYQAHHLDMDFYDMHFKQGAYTKTQAEHQEKWHGGERHVSKY